MSFNRFPVSSSNPPQGASGPMANAVSAPQSENPVSVVLPPADSTPQVPTPDQSGSAWQHRVDGLVTPQFSGRGKPLTDDEDLCLVRLSRENLLDDNTDYHPKRYWVKISTLLLQKTGRNYSWTSCQRRMARLVKTRSAALYLQTGVDPQTMHSQTKRDARMMTSAIRDELDDWTRECDHYRLEGDAKREEETREERIKLHHEWFAAEEKREVSRRARYRRANVKKAEVMDAYVERLRLESVLAEKTKGLAAEIDASRKQKQNGVQNWLDQLPSEPGIEPLSRPGGVGSRRMPECGHPSRQRDRSRSPRREGQYYRQRSRSPRGHRATEATTSANRIVRGYFQRPLTIDSSDKSAVAEQGVNVDTPGRPPQNNRSAQPCHGGEEELDMPQHLTDSIDKLALNFSSSHLQPLFLGLKGDNVHDKLSSLDMVDSACLAMFRGVASITMEFLNNRIAK